MYGSTQISKDLMIVFIISNMREMTKRHLKNFLNLPLIILLSKLWDFYSCDKQKKCRNIYI